MAVSFIGGGNRQLLVQSVPLQLLVQSVPLQLLVQSVPIATNVVSLNPFMARCTRYNIMFVSDLRQVGGFLFRVLRFPPPIEQTATI
jgi:hypothetical protein